MVEYYGNTISWIPNIDKTVKSKYLAIVECIEKDIESGKLSYGQKMPSQRLIANYLGMNHGTVTRAYKICEEKGVLRGVVGKGTFVNSSVGLPVGLLTAHDDNDIINLGFTLPLYEMNKEISNHIKAVSDSINYDLVLKYCPPKGMLKHRYVAAKYLENYNMTCDAANIVITAGTQNALSVILFSMFEKSDRIIVDEYTYTGLKELAKYLGIILVPVECDRCGMDKDVLKKTCARDNIKGIYLMPDCHNPYSVNMSEQRRDELADLIIQNSLILIEDATFGFTSMGKTTPISMRIPQNSFYIHGTSKAISPSFRISHIVSPDKYTQKIIDALNNITWMASAYNSEIISLLQSTKRYDKIVQKKIGLMEDRNKLYDEIFGIKDVCYNTMFRLLKLPPDKDCTTFEKEALKKGVQVFSANRFCASSESKLNAVRVSLCSTNDIESLRCGLEIIKEMI